MASELWTEIVDPTELTGFTRNFYADFLARELKDNTLTTHFPTRAVNDVKVSTTEIEAMRPVMASNRAWDAEPSIGDAGGAKKRIFELPPISHKIPLSEYQQIIARAHSDKEYVRDRVVNAAQRAVLAIDATLEYQRGLTLTTGKYVRYHEGTTTLEDDWGRDADMSVTVAKKWNETGANPLQDLINYVEAYRLKNGTAPGTLLVSPKVRMLLQSNDKFRVELAGGASRPATFNDVDAILQGYGIPALTTYERFVNKNGVNTRVLDENSIYLLPAPGSDLGATLFAPTLSATAAGWAQADAQGIYTGLYRNTTVPLGAHVVADAIAMPALANPNLAFVAKVL